MHPALRHALVIVLAALATGSAVAQEYALELDPGAVVKFPHDPVMNTDKTVTIEGWMRSLGTATGGDFNPFARYAGSAEHKQLYISHTGIVRQIYAGSPWAQSGACLESAPGAFPIDGAWHHVAFVRHDDDSWETYVDGTEVNSGAPGSCCWLTCATINATPDTLVIGQLGWQLLSLRVSNIDRYHAPFVPQHCWSADPDTILLLDLDEGAGTAVADSSPEAQTGTIVGGYTWVPVNHTAATSYCTAGASANGCTPALYTCGFASATSPVGFEITATQVEGGRNGVLLFGANGRQALAWGNGTSFVCVAPPARRGGLLQGSGTHDQCDGTLTKDLNAHWCAGCQRPSHNPGAGALVQAQVWYRDPKSTSNQTTSLSNAIEFTVAP
jgi:hypothetical protein